MKWLGNVLDKSAGYLSCVFLMIMSVTIILSVFFRYVLSVPFPGAEEIARYCMIWGTYLGVSVCVRQNSHVGVDALVSALPKALQQLCEVLVLLIVVALNVALFVLAFQITRTIAASGQTSAANVIPMWIPYLALPVSFGLSTFHAIVGLPGNIKAVFEKKEESEVGVS